MNETNIKVPETIKEISQELHPNGETKRKELTTLKGYTTSQINQALKADNPYPARVFLKVEGQEQDIPIFFRIKEKKYQIKPCLECNYPKKGNWEKKANCQTKEVQHQLEEVWIRPKIKKGSYLEVKGQWTIKDPSYSNRKSFTATSYQILNSQPAQEFKSETLINHHE